MKTIVNLTISFIGALLFPHFICNNSLRITNSIVCVVIMGVIFLLLQRQNGHGHSMRLKLLSGIFGIILSLFTSFGCRLGEQHSIPFFDIKLIAAVLIYGYIYAAAVRSIWLFLERKEKTLAEQQYSERFVQSADRIANAVLSRPVLIFIIMLACWAPCYISTYPGGFRYDASAEFIQYYQGYNGDFPLLHSFIITRLIIYAHHFTQSCNTGVAIYTVTQMLALGALFTNIIYTLKKQNINRFVLCMLAVYYAAFPAIHLLVTCTVRDVMFSGLVTYLVFLLYITALDPKAFMSKTSNAVKLAVVPVLALLSRNNNAGIAAPIALAAVSAAVVFICRKDNLKNAVIFLFVSIGSYLALSAGLSYACRPFTPANPGSALAVCSQSLVRSYFADGENWPEEDLGLFEEFFDTENLTYVAENADPTKFNLTIAQGKTGEFIKFWLKKGIEYPSVYLNAILANSRQMWFPDVVVNGYNQAGKFVSYDKCYFTFADSINEPAVLAGYLPQVRSFYKQIGLMLSFEKIPVVSMLFSIGFHFWLLLNCCFYAVYRRCRHLYLPLLVLLMYAVISSFVPLVLLRYFSALFFAFPMVAAFTLQPERK